MVETYQDIVDVAERVRSKRLDKQAVLEEILLHRTSRLTSCGSPSGNHGQRDELISTLVDWAVRLVTMLEVGQLQNVFQSRELSTWKH